MSDRVNMLLVQEILGDPCRVFQDWTEGGSKEYLARCLHKPHLLNYAFNWEGTFQGHQYWEECHDGMIPDSEVNNRMSILLPLIYDKPLTLEDLM